MSWSVNIDGKDKADAKNKIDESMIPASLRSYVKEQIDAYAHDSALKVVAYGHEIGHENDKMTVAISLHKS